MTITGNEVVVDNQMRRAEKQNQSPVNRLLEGAESTAKTASLVTRSVTFGCIAKTLDIARKFTSELGVATLSENLDHLGDATEAALSRVEKNLEAQGVQIDEIERRMNSNEFYEGIKSATLQAQRTKDKKRLERMALILANGVAEDDLEPENLDDMMRTAVELRSRDIEVLRLIYEMQDYMFKPGLVNIQQGQRMNDLQKRWSAWWAKSIPNYQGSEGMAFNSSCVRLQSVGLIASIGAKSFAQSPTTSDYELLPEGAKFYERLQEIGVESNG